MIILFTSPDHRYTFNSVRKGMFGCPTPRLSVVDYSELFAGRTVKIPRGTYVFGDLDRLTPPDLQRAANLYRSLTSQGLRCLNDPARAMSRAELLTTLHARGINPFAVARADTMPRPPRFPVFIRNEAAHVRPVDELYHNQAELDRALEKLRAGGTPLRGMLVVEQAAERYSERFWARWGTWRIGDRMIVEQLLLDESWVVKRGHYLNMDEAAIADEHDAVTTNRYADELRAVFEIGGIEFGRADHAPFAGRTIVYEINTNPLLSRFEADPRPLREATQRHSRRSIADALAAIDSDVTGSVIVEWEKPAVEPPLPADPAGV